MAYLLERLPSGSRIAVIRLRSLGDCVLTTPALELLKAPVPTADRRGGRGPVSRRSSKAIRMSLNSASGGARSSEVASPDGPEFTAARAACG